tara:strand:+ start:1412 stop:2026 length:615 start_codon:yes stop_codon:yes gene_type:complete
MPKYPLIVFEGIEASGKSTHIKNVAKYLRKIKRKFITIREPGGSKYSEILRNLILNKKSKFTYKTDFLLILASRSENMDKIIRNNYKKKIILIDRFKDSTIAYQHFGQGIDINLINKLNTFIVEKVNVDFTFVNIVNKKNIFKRLLLRNNLKNKYDNFNINFYNRVQKGFLKIAKNKKKYKIIDSNQNFNKNKELIIKKIKKLI